METNKMIERSAAIRAVKDYFFGVIERNGMEALNLVDTSADICRAIESLPESEPDGSLALLLKYACTSETRTDGSKTLGNVGLGEAVTIGEREYIVLDHSKDTTAVIVKEPVKSMAFGKDGDYINSDVRKYCNGEFYKELCEAVGKDNVIPHTVKLVADDGSNKGASVKDNVSILTTDLYRRWRELLPAIGSSCWTATRVTTLANYYTRYFCVVNAYGFFDWNDCDFSNGVRPFCILNSSVKIN